MASRIASPARDIRADASSGEITGRRGRRLSEASVACHMGERSVSERRERHFGQRIWPGGPESCRFRRSACQIRSPCGPGWGRRVGGRSDNGRTCYQSWSLMTIRFGPSQAWPWHVLCCLSCVGQIGANPVPCEWIEQSGGRVGQRDRCGMMDNWNATGGDRLCEGVRRLAFCGKTYDYMVINT